MNDNDIINKIIEKYNLEVINKENVELLIESFEKEGFYFNNTNVEDLNKTFNDRNIKVEIDIIEFLSLDCLVYSNEELIAELLKSGYKDTLEISKDFPNIV
jgi:hypothetical protein